MLNFVNLHKKFPIKIQWILFNNFHLKTFILDRVYKIPIETVEDKILNISTLVFTHLPGETKALC